MDISPYLSVCFCVWDMQCLCDSLPDCEVRKEEIVLEHVANHSLHGLAQPLAVESHSPCVCVCA